LILVDVNLLIYASIEESPHHSAALAWLDRQLNGRTRVGLPWPSLLGFLRVVTNRRALAQPLSMEDAWGQVGRWLQQEVVWTPNPTDAHAEVLGRLLAFPGMVANLVHDAELAALAIEHGLTMCSADRDFARFPGLRWENPLAG
jgi:toxin-antitoxin system PIN domain toxin